MKAGILQLQSQWDRVSERLDTLLARIPDVSRAPLWQQISVGAALALLIHFFVFIALVILFYEGFQNRTVGREDQPLEIEIVPMPARQTALVPPKPKTMPILDSKGLEESAEKPKNAEFESDRDMAAGSEMPAAGLLNLPSQEGRDDLPGHNFATQDVTLGLIKPKAPAAPPSPRQEPAVAPQPPAGLRPLYDPQPVAKEALAKAEKAPPTKTIPQPATTPVPVERATPPPLKVSDAAREDSMAVTRLSPVSTPGPVTKLQPIPTPAPQPAASPTPRWMAMLTTPAPLPVPNMKQRYQESLTKTRIEGNITKSGKPGVDAVKGPLGKYYRDMSLQVGSRWNQYTAKATDMLNLGTVKVRFNIRADGRVTNAEVIEDGGDRHHAEVCLRAVQTSKLPPLPPDIVDTLADGTLEIVYSFTLF